MKKIIVTPAGRRRYLEVLLQHLIKNKNEFDTWQIWVNTTDKEDIDYMVSIEQAHDFINLVYCKIPVNGNWSIHTFFVDCMDPNSVYLRLDDDIVYVHPGSISTMFENRIKDEGPFLMYGNIVNNAVITHLHQRTGVLPITKPVNYACMDKVGWNDPEFAYTVHQNFFKKHKENRLEEYFMNNWILWDYERVSINGICWLGKTFAEFNGNVGHDEEQWLSVDYPASVKRPNKIIGNTLFSHYSFFTQRPYLDTTDTLSVYKTISNE
jgi:hypothetical protein